MRDNFALSLKRRMSCEKSCLNYLINKSIVAKVWQRVDTQTERSWHCEICGEGWYAFCDIKAADNHLKSFPKFRSLVISTSFKQTNRIICLLN